MGWEGLNLHIKNRRRTTETLRQYLSIGACLNQDAFLLVYSVGHVLGFIHINVFHERL